MKSKPTDNWAALLGEELMNNEVRPPGSGWVTSAEMSRSMGLSASQVVKKLKCVVESGKVDVFKGRIASGGRLCQQVWYRIKKGKK